MRKKLTIEEFIEKSNKIHREKYDYSKVNYINRNTKVCIICPFHGDFLQKPIYHLYRRGCPKCGGNLKSSTKEFIEKAKKIHGEKYDYSKANYINSSNKVIIICPTHGEFLQTPNNHYSYGCIQCGYEKSASACRSNREDFIEKSVKIHGNKYNYDNVVYKNSNTDVKIICPIHGEFLQKANAHLHSYGCPRCAVIGRKQNIPKTTQKFIEDAIKIHGNKYDYSKVNYIDCNTKVEIICLNHGSFWQKPAGHLSGKGCTFCVHIVSKPERKFLNYLKIPEIKTNRQKRIEKYKVDGIKGNKIFEFLGDYYHGNPIKHNHNNVNPTNKKLFGELYNDTIKKFNRLNTIGYDIYYIWENDWNKWNKKLIKTFPIKKYKVNKLI